MPSVGLQPSRLARLGLAMAVLIAIALVLLLLFPEPLRATPKAGKARVDHLELAAILLRDGHVDRAAALFAQVNPKTAGLDLKRYHTLGGLIAARRGDHRSAAYHLRTVLGLGASSHPTLRLQLAQSRFHLKDFRGALEALSAAGEAAQAVWGAFLIKAQAHVSLGQQDEAFRALGEGLRRHPGAVALRRQLVLLLVKLELYVAAAEEGHRLLAMPQATLQDTLGIAEALRRARQPEKAALLLEEARIIHPWNRQVLLQLARCHLDAGRPLASATLLHRASYVDSGLRVEAAELYRRAKQPGLALLLNEQVGDQKKKIKQRFGLLVELGRFEEAAALEPRLSRLGLLGEQEVLYALAFCLVRIGRLVNAETVLTRVTEPAFFHKVVELRRVLTACREAGWQCAR